MGKGLIAGSADRFDLGPTSTSIAFEPYHVEDVLPSGIPANLSDPLFERQDHVVHFSHASSADKRLDLAEKAGQAA